MYKTDVATTKQLLRLIQSVPSPKAEPFKQWLAQMGNERLEEVANPEIAMQRAIDTYRKKGYSEKWITQRMRSIDVKSKPTRAKKQSVKRIPKHRNYWIIKKKKSLKD